MTKRCLLLLLAPALLAGCGTTSSTSTSAGLAPVPVTSVRPGTQSLVISQQGSLVRLDAQGQNRFVLTQGFNDSDPAFRPDGSDLIFSRQGPTGKADLYRIKPDGTGLVDLTADFPFSAVQPGYSWNGRHIVFAAVVGPQDQDIYLMNADGSGITALTSGPELDADPAMSTDGSTVVFQRGSRISRVASSGGPVSDLTEGSRPQYSPPGNDLIFVRSGDVWRRGADGTVSQVSHTPYTAEFECHNLSAGAIVALASLTPGTSLGRQDAPTGDLEVMSQDGNQVQLLTSNLGASSVAVSPSATAAGSSVPTMLVNNSASTLYIYVFGYDPANGFKPSYLATDGSVKAYSPATGVPPSLATVTANGGTASLNLPLLNKARVYFSNNPNLAWSDFEEGPSLTDATQVYDFVEYNYVSAGGDFTADTSCVESFALPFKIETTPAGTANGVAVSGVGMEAGQRSQVFTAIANLGTPWSNLIVNPGANPSRLLAPWHGDMASPAFPADYLDPSIARQWGQALTLNTYLGSFYVAQASTGAWVFQPQSGSGASVTFAQAPSSKTAFSCAIPFTSSDQGVGSRIAAILAAGLNRGTLLFPNLNPTPIPFTPVTPGQPDFSPGDFYQTSTSDPQKVPQVNQYANILHQHSLNQYQYGFASDDQGSQSSTLVVPAATPIQSMRITVSSY